MSVVSNSVESAGLAACRAGFGPVQAAVAGAVELIVDDWAETGSQASTVQQLVRGCGAVLVGISLMIDQLDELTRAELTNVASLARFTDLPALD